MGVTVPLSRVADPGGLYMDPDRSSRKPDKDPTYEKKKLDPDPPF